MMKGHTFRFALGAFGIIALCFLFSPSPCTADPISIGASTSSTVQAYSYSYEIAGALTMGGFASGSSYDFGFVGSVFCGGEGAWYWCSGGPTSYSLDVPGVFDGELYGSGATVTLTQASVDAPIVLTYIVDGYTVVFDMYEDPVLLSSLEYESPQVDGVSYVDLTVTGGCYDDSATACTPAAAPSSAAEPSSLGLLAAGLAGLGLMIGFCRWEKQLHHESQAAA
jgi:hypothetical protein